MRFNFLHKYTLFLHVYSTLNDNGRLLLKYLDILFSQTLFEKLKQTFLFDYVFMQKLSICMFNLMQTPKCLFDFSIYRVDYACLTYCLAHLKLALVILRLSVQFVDILKCQSSVVLAGGDEGKKIQWICSGYSASLAQTHCCTEVCPHARGRYDSDLKTSRLTLMHAK